MVEIKNVYINWKHLGNVPSANSNLQFARASFNCGQLQRVKFKVGPRRTLWLH